MLVLELEGWQILKGRIMQPLTPVLVLVIQRTAPVAVTRAIKLALAE